MNNVCDNEIILINESPDEKKIAENLSEQASLLIKNRITVFKSIDSTNIEAKRCLKKCENSLHGSVFLAEHQTAGRGRLGKKFYSPAKTGIYLSIIYDADKYNIKNSDTTGITVAAGVAVQRTLTQSGIDSGIKWVNDIFVNGKKVCGILTEGVLGSAQSGIPKIENFIIGIGINIFESEAGFPDDIKDIAGAVNIRVSKNLLISKLLNNIADIFSEKTSYAEIMNEYRLHSVVVGKTVSVITAKETFDAKAVRITDEAHLIVQRLDGSEEELMCGEVSLKI
ncbi:MAG: biotin--[acetyl-CoA-carboxylase] ligase [Spirochaetales bacterium]